MELLDIINHIIQSIFIAEDEDSDDDRHKKKKKKKNRRPRGMDFILDDVEVDSDDAEEVR